MKNPTKMAIAIALTMLFCSPAKAADNSNPSSIIDQLNQQIQSVNSFIEEQVSSVTDGLSKLVENTGTDLSAALNNAIGQMGIPDLNKIENSIKDSVGAETNPSTLSNEIDRQVTDAIAAGTLSETGQQQTLSKLQQTQSAVQQTQSANESAQSAVASQDVLKQIAAQNAQNAAILGSLQAQTIENTTRQDLANTNLTNISKSLDEQKSAEDNERRNSGLSTLKTASKASLF